MKSLYAFLCLVPILFAQNDNLYIPINIEQAYINQTRSLDGFPGPNYWQNSANYDIKIDIDPISGLLKGKEKIEYQNNSPDTLEKLYIHLFMNIYKKGNPREYAVNPEDENEGVIIDQLLVNGYEIEESAIEYVHNDFILHLTQPLPPNQNIQLSIDWQFTINKNSHFRTGQVDSTSWFVAYFFPRVAVYDDIDGWNDFKYSGSAEFYNDFGNLNVNITVPQNFIVWGTGMLQNPNEVLNKQFVNKLQKATNSNQIVKIISPTDLKNGNITRSNKTNTWNFKASNVTDFAFALSDHYLWDATSIVVDTKTKRRVLIDAAYNQNSKDFYSVANIARKSINYMSGKFPGVPFPYPNLTVFNGLDEMEYPMMVNNLSTRDSVYVVKLTSHEIFHTYFPFYMGTNESKYAWMDEGFASFGDYLITSELLSEKVADFYYLDLYKSNAGTEVDVPIITNSKNLTRPMYHLNAYVKSASFLYILKDFLGEELFVSVIQEFINRWNGKHPTPYDFFNTLNHFTSKNLNWLITPWFFEFGYVDMAIKQVLNKKIIIEKIGHYPAPVHLLISYKNGKDETIKKPVSVWKDGKTTITIPIKNISEIEKLELLNRLVTDADVSNNIFYND